MSARLPLVQPLEYWNVCAEQQLNDNTARKTNITVIEIFIVSSFLQHKLISRWILAQNVFYKFILTNLNTLFIKNCIQITRKGVDELTTKSPGNAWVNDLVVRYKPFSPNPTEGVPDEDMMEITAT